MHIKFVNRRTHRLQTFSSILDENAGVAPGFDFIRLFLATTIVLWHSIYYTHPHEVAERIWHSPFATLINTLVPFFFALSGFLVTGSLLRLRDLRLFLAFRVLRIIPALLVEVSLSAIVLGLLLTTLPVSKYFSDPEFYSYFANIAGFVHYQLPGVFKNQFYDQVNGALWTIPGEMCCYVSLVAFTLLGLSMRRQHIAIVFGVASVSAYLWSRKFGSLSTQNWVPLVFCFYAGSLLFHYRSRIPHHWILALGAAILTYCISQFRFSLYIVLAPLLTAYVVCYFGMKKLPHIPWLMDGDHSYGIYLYHSPIVQTFVWLSSSTIKWWECFFLSYASVVIFSMLSWKFIEKPALELRKSVVKRQATQRRSCVG